MIALMVTCVHVALALRLKLKKGEPLLVFTCLWFDIIIFWLAFRKIQDCVIEEEEFENLKD
jgi:hypothetical protein